jgi:hypothetical protein
VGQHVYACSKKSADWQPGHGPKAAEFLSFLVCFKIRQFSDPPDMSGDHQNFQPLFPEVE